jgi:hypothetical protein
MASGVNEEIHRRLKGFFTLRGLVDVAEDKLTLAACVGGAHHPRDARRIEDLPHNFKLIFCLLVFNQWLSPAPGLERRQ